MGIDPARPIHWIERLMLNGFFSPGFLPRAERSEPMASHLMGAALASLESLAPGVVPFPARRPPDSSMPDLPMPEILGGGGPLRIMLARNAQDVRRAQRLRFEVFFKEMRARPSASSRLLRRDIDAYDAICDHLLVVDTSKLERRPGRKPRPAVVGTYRLLRQERTGTKGFYTQGEFNVAPLIARHPGKRFLELGRSCVAAEYRTKRTVELLWHGIWAYVRHHRIDVMFGCASLGGTDPEKLEAQLAFLHHHARAGDEWRASAHAGNHVPMDRLGADEIDAKAAARAMPPLLKGYLRLGARFGDGAAIDRQFGTTDVLVVLPVAEISPRYVEHYGTEGRYAA
jgi:putative hemolysin